MKIATKVLLGADAKQAVAANGGAGGFTLGNATQILGFQVREIRKQSASSFHSETVGYNAYYPAYGAKGRPDVFVQAQTKRALKAAIAEVRQGWSK